MATPGVEPATPGQREEAPYPLRCGRRLDTMGAFLTFQKDADGIYPGWKEKLGYTGESSVQAASFDWKKKAAAAAFVGAAAAKEESVVACHALDQSSRYADLSIDEGSLSKNGRHVLVAYIMKPKAGYDYLATAAHLAAESSTGTNVNV
jgi:hypothetical protein